MKLLIQLCCGIACAILIWQISPYISWDGSAANIIESSPSGKNGNWQKVLIILYSPVTIIGLTIAMMGFFISAVARIHKRLSQPSIKA